MFYIIIMYIIIIFTPANRRPKCKIIHGRLTILSTVTGKMHQALPVFEELLQTKWHEFRKKNAILNLKDSRENTQNERGQLQGGFGVSDAQGPR